MFEIKKSSDGWLELVKKTSKESFFNTVPKCFYCEDRHVLKPSLRARLVRLGIPLVGGSLALCMIVWASLWSFGVGYGRVGYFLIGVFIVCTTSKAILSEMIFSVRKITFSDYTSEVSFYFGNIFAPKITTLSKEEFIVKIDVSSGAIFSGAKRGCPVVSLQKNSEDKSAANLFCHSDKNKLTAVYEKLVNYFCPENSVDSSIVEEVSDKGSIRIDRSSISGAIGSFPLLQLCVSPLKDKAVFSRTLHVYAFFTAFLIIPMLAETSLIIEAVNHPDWPTDVAGFVLMSSMCILLATIGVIGLSKGFGTTKVVAEKENEVVSISQGFFAPKYGKTVYKFNEIAGIQICSRHNISDDDEDGFTSFEINIVLYNQPITQRITILGESKESRVVDYSQRFAKFLDKPLFDHR